MESARYQDYLHVPESEPSYSSVCQTPAMTWLDRDLFNYFYYFLETKGHVNVLDMELHDYTKLLPKSYQARIHSLGGLDNYLCFDPRFKISHDIVSIAGVDKNELVGVPDLPTTSQHVLSTASVCTQKDRTTTRHKDVPTPASVNREFSNLSVNECLLNSSRSDSYETSGHRSHQKLQDNAEFKKELQTMFMELQGELDFLKQNSAAKDSRKCCHKMISHNTLLVDELKWDNRKLKNIIQKAEALEEIWKTSYDVLLRELNDLQTINHAQIAALNKQLESETTKSFNTETAISHEFSTVTNNGFRASSNKKCHALFIEEHAQATVPDKITYLPWWIVRCKS